MIGFFFLAGYIVVIRRLYLLKQCQTRFQTSFFGLKKWFKKYLPGELYIGIFFFFCAPGGGERIAVHCATQYNTSIVI